MSKLQKISLLLLVINLGAVIYASSPVVALAQGDWVITAMVDKGDTTLCNTNCVTISFQPGNIAEIVNSAGNSSEMNWMIIDSTLRFIKPKKAKSKSGSSFMPGTFILKDHSEKGLKELLMIHEKYGYTYILKPLMPQSKGGSQRR